MGGRWVGGRRRAREECNRIGKNNGKEKRRIREVVIVYRDYTKVKNGEEQSMCCAWKARMDVSANGNGRAKR